MRFVKKIFKHNNTSLQQISCQAFFLIASLQIFVQETKYFFIQTAKTYQKSNIFALINFCQNF
jgi:hypothetical protein